MVVSPTTGAARNSLWRATAWRKTRTVRRAVIAPAEIATEKADKNVCPTHMIRVVLPFHLRTLARIDGEVQLEVEGPVTLRSVLDALEARYPMLKGTIRDHVTAQRRAFIRFYACQQDFSHESPDTPLPEAVASGTEPFLVVGAIAGG